MQKQNRKKRKMTDTPRVALLMDTSRAFERNLVRGIAKYSCLNGHWNFYREVPSIIAGNPQLVRMIKNWSPDGMIIREQKQTSALLELGVPVVIAPSESCIPGYANIRTNDVEIGRLGAEHLIEIGLQNLAYCGLDEIFVWSRGRRDSFCDSAAQAGLEVQCYTASSNSRQFTWAQERESIARWLHTLSKPLGLMVYSDDYCLCVIEACSLAGYRIPEDVAIVGVGNDEMICDLTFPPLSSIALGASHGGYAAAENLAQQMAGQSEIRDVVVEPSGVVCRSSSDILAIGNQEIVQAIHFIRQNLKHPLLVDDVAQAVALSRRTLQSQFSQATGRGVSEYIRTARATYAARLLLETTMSISQIANSLGFPDEKNFARFFRREKSLNPGEFRKAKNCPTL